jgi:DNA-binding transcriptional regulator GbsR (MarR family)
MPAEHATVKYLVSSAGAHEAPSESEAIRRRFALAWGQMGAAWGIAPSTAAVQGYLLVHGGPVTDRELEEALGLSHRAIQVALADCEQWGVVQRAPEPRRTGQRGPAGRAWLALDDHWEWFRRVVEARKGREGDPVIAILEECLRAARASATAGEPDATDLTARVESLLIFVREFDHALSAVVRARTDVLRKLFGALSSQDPETLDRLLANLSEVPDKELANALATVSRLPPGSLRRLLRLAGQPAVARLLGGR